MLSFLRLTFSPRAECTAFCSESDQSQPFPFDCGAPNWRFTSSTRMLERARAIAYALRASGLQAGDRVAVMSENRVDWLAADFGGLLAGCVVVPTSFAPSSRYTGPAATAARNSPCGSAH